MSLTLGQVLEEPVVQLAKPEVLHGHHLLGRTVRWVHTSEIFEIGSLLRGGEVLIVSGLGLVGAGNGALTAYVDRLADRGASALFFELGRTFDQVPQAVVEAAGRADLPLVALHEIVPFVDITYAIHRLLMRQETENALWIEEIDGHIHGALLDDAGMQELLRRVELLGGAPVELWDASNRLVASGGTSLSAPPDSEAVVAQVHVRGERWGQVLLQAAQTPYLRLLAARAAVAIGIALIRAQSWARNEENSSSKLLDDIVRNRFVSGDELNARARAIGFDCSGSQLVGLALTVDATLAPPSARAAVQEIVGRTALVGETNGEILVAAALASGGDASVRSMATWLVEQMSARPAARGGGRVVAVAAGPPVPTLSSLGGSMAAAQDARALMSDLGLTAKVMLSSEVTMYRLLSRFSTDPELERFVSEQLGRVMDHDASHGTALLATLEALVESGWNKTDAAERLHVRRQTVYRRIASVEELVVGSLEDAECRVQLSLAIKARMVRSAGTRRSL